MCTIADIPSFWTYLKFYYISMLMNKQWIPASNFESKNFLILRVKNFRDKVFPAREILIKREPPTCIVSRRIPSVPEETPLLYMHPVTRAGTQGVTIPRGDEGGRRGGGGGSYSHE